ncbi:hypothetical protein PS2_012575 [Malus domestica]|uniref:uncharacterized protein n=1 Tax=Malus domestica TaxID=3750 RepID=UPI00397708B8
MGCFLACFGFSKKRKRRNPATKAPSGDHRRVSYVPLDSSVRIIGVDGGGESLKSELYRDKAKEQKRLKTRKKVSFNLNVQTYEPISTAYHFLDSYEEEEIGEKNVKEMSKGRLSTSASERDSTTLRVGLFPSSYRYQNVRDSYEEEESELHDNDIDVVDEDDYYDDDEDSEIDEQQISREGFSEELPSASRNGESEYPDARDNIRYVISVLSPVENLTQWKAAKAAAPKHQKENTALLQQPRMPYSTRSNFKQPTKPLLQEVPVHASLSSWLNSQSTN